jgi:hypothetical protein
MPPIRKINMITDLCSLSPVKSAPSNKTVVVLYNEQGKIRD